MRLVPLVLGAVLLAATVMAAGDEPVGEVLVLDDENFDRIVAEHDVLLVEFYAPWCGHCKALAPKYDEAAKALANSADTKHIRIAKMDAEAEKKTGSRFGVSGFPTIKLFRSGEVAGDYDGERTAEAIVDFMKKKAATAVNKEITDPAALKKITKAATQPTLVALCSNKDHVDYKLYKSVVSKLADTGLEVYHAVAPAVLEEFGYFSSGCNIQIYRPTEGGKKPTKATFKGTVFKDKLREWIVANALTPFAKYTPDTAKLFGLVAKNIIRIVRTKDAPAIDIKPLQALAKKHENAFLFATSDAADYKADMEAHCDKSTKACVLLQDVKKNRVFGLEGSAITVESIEKFIEDFNDNKLKQKVKSEPTPAANKAGDVAVIVGTTFESEVINNDKDMFVEFYAPWCGHCKALAPKLDELAKDLESEYDSLAVAKIDLTSNDLPGEFKNVYAVSGFPTMYFAPKGKKSTPIKYEGERDAAAMKKWLQEKRSK